MVLTYELSKNTELRKFLCILKLIYGENTKFLTENQSIKPKMSMDYQKFNEEMVEVYL